MKNVNKCQEKFKYKFSPIIYDYWFCSEADKASFYILMEKYDDNLYNFIKKLGSNEASKVASILALEKLEKDLDLIHEICGICLNDIKPENILYKQIDTFKYEFVFADFGKSTNETNEICIKNDRNKFKSTIEQFHQNLKLM
jgi:serine/threonine protein kinase